MREVQHKNDQKDQMKDRFEHSNSFNWQILVPWSCHNWNHTFQEH